MATKDGLGVSLLYYKDVLLSGDERVGEIGFLKSVSKNERGTHVFILKFNEFEVILWLCPDDWLVDLRMSEEVGVSLFGSCYIVCGRTAPHP